MKKPEEIKKWLNCLAFKCDLYHLCGECEYEELCEDPDTAHQYAPNALAYIEQLENQIDLMQEQMHGDCGVCSHRHDFNMDTHGLDMSQTCYECLQKETRPNWEYEGLPE